MIGDTPFTQDPSIVIPEDYIIKDCSKIKMNPIVKSGRTVSYSNKSDSNGSLGELWDEMMEKWTNIIKLLDDDLNIKIIASPFQRTKQTACLIKNLFPSTRNVTIETMEDLRESYKYVYKTLPIGSNRNDYNTRKDDVNIDDIETFKLYTEAVTKIITDNTMSHVIIVGHTPIFTELYKMHYGPRHYKNIVPINAMGYILINRSKYKTIYFIDGSWTEYNDNTGDEYIEKQLKYQLSAKIVKEKTITEQLKAEADRKSKEEAQKAIEEAERPQEIHNAIEYIEILKAHTQNDLSKIYYVEDYSKLNDITRENINAYMKLKDLINNDDINDLRILYILDLNEYLKQNDKSMSNMFQQNILKPLIPNN